ncbi:MBOAT family O-acyltransferase [Spirosoma sp.]|uniref:MBOAT family O-acyltransferase n=1 Tax=Spirosoma sp. TaxID=1899569 RepID=UPI0034463FFF
MAFVPIYILILGFTIIIDYFAGLLIEKASGKQRKWFLISSLFANISVLCIFKYYNFLNDNLSSVLNQFNYDTPFPALKILLPIGLSFHTFQAMSYTIEIYRGKQPAEKKFGIYALYVMFYPQLVAGPIERPQNVLHQFYEKHTFKAENISEGLKLIAWGLFKKVVIADRFAVVVDKVYNDPRHFEGWPLIFSTLLFSFQIYCDFSGYSDIALGTARVIGFRLMKNFNSPYFSTSISEFWKRWHISLSTWFRDYLYIPLGGNRVASERRYFNLFITFLISGLWHGANWTYVIWGSLNGIYIIGENSTKNFFNKLYLSTNFFSKNRKAIGLISTFTLTCFAWIFFRAKTIQDAFYIVEHLFSNLQSSFSQLKPSNLGTTQYDYIIGFLALIILLCIEGLNSRISVNMWLKRQNLMLRVSIYYVLVMFILLFGSFDLQEQFIYFQF